MADDLEKAVHLEHVRDYGYTQFSSVEQKQEFLL